MHHHSLPLQSSSFTTSRGAPSSHANSPVSSLLLILLTLKFMEEPHPTSNNASTSPPPRDQRAESPPPSSLDYDVVVIMAAMICALVCALGLNSMLRCVVRCTRHALTEPVGWVAHRRANAGLKREDVVALPVATYAAPPLQPSSSSGSPAPQPPGCAICLSDFADGDKIRLLPACGHRFHVGCIDTWLLSRCSCPTCRRRLLSAQGIAEGSPLDV